MNLNWLLVFIPIGVGLNWFGASPILVFLVSALGIVPLTRLMGEATEALAEDLGPTVGGLLNATLGNAPEMIIAGFALHAGLVRMVKSSLTGSIIGNLLFGVGVSFFLGGIKHGRPQHFDPGAARITTALLTLASFGLIIPAATQFSGAAAPSISRSATPRRLSTPFALRARTRWTCAWESRRARARRRHSWWRRSWSSWVC
jgi:Ca2+:H+ antiporter